MQRKYDIDNSRTPRAPVRNTARRWLPHLPRAVRVVCDRPFTRVLAVLMMAAWPLAPANAQDAIYSADRVKAAFIYHFSTYVNWPEPVAANGEFTIAVLGADDVATELEQFVPGHAIQGRPMSVRRLRSVDELGSEEVLFVGADRNSRLPEYLEVVESRPVLVVTDVPDGLHQGAMINFRVVDSRVRFEISQRAAESVGLELSSRLLAAAMFVDTAGAIVDISSNVVATSSDSAANRGHSRSGMAVSSPGESINPGSCDFRTVVRKCDP